MTDRCTATVYSVPHSTGVSIKLTEPLVCYVHTSENTPDPIRTLKLSSDGLD